jgi:ankyrin repeat protein
MISLYSDIYKLVISFVKEKSDISCILLTCKAFNFIGYKCLHKNFNINNVAIWACKNNNSLLLKKLLEISKIDPSRNIMICACQFGNHETAALLLKDPRIDPSAEDNYAIKVASQYGCLKIVATLLKDHRGRAEPCGPKAVDPSVQDQYALRWAAENGFHKVVALLLQDPRGRAPPDGPEGR